MDDNICIFCSEKFENEHLLNRHLLTAKKCIDIRDPKFKIVKFSKPEKFKCGACDKEFDKKQAYDLHLETEKHIKNSKRYHPCKACDLTFKNLSSLKTHQKTKKCQKNSIKYIEEGEEEIARNNSLKIMKVNNIMEKQKELIKHQIGDIYINMDIKYMDYSTNNYVNMSPLALTPDELSKIIHENITARDLVTGPEGIAKKLKACYLKNNYKTIDCKRGKSKYNDKITGSINVDTNCEKLKKAIVPSLLEKLNDCWGDIVTKYQSCHGLIENALDCKDIEIDKKFTRTVLKEN